MLVCTRLCLGTGTQWDSQKYMNMKQLETVLSDASIA
jgi:hypothetical protein